MQAGEARFVVPQSPPSRRCRKPSDHDQKILLPPSAHALACAAEKLDPRLRRHFAKRVTRRTRSRAGSLQDAAIVFSSTSRSSIATSWRRLAYPRRRSTWPACAHGRIRTCSTHIARRESGLAGWSASSGRDCLEPASAQGSLSLLQLFFGFVHPQIRQPIRFLVQLAPHVLELHIVQLHDQQPRPHV